LQRTVESQVAQSQHLNTVAWRSGERPHRWPRVSQGPVPLVFGIDQRCRTVQLAFGLGAQGVDEQVGRGERLRSRNHCSPQLRLIPAGTRPASTDGVLWPLRCSELPAHWRPWLGLVISLTSTGKCGGRGTGRRSVGKAGRWLFLTVRSKSAHASRRVENMARCGAHRLNQHPQVQRASEGFRCSAARGFHRYRRRSGRSPAQLPGVEA